MLSLLSAAVPPVKQPLADELSLVNIFLIQKKQKNNNIKENNDLNIAEMSNIYSRAQITQ